MNKPPLPCAPRRHHAHSLPSVETESIHLTDVLLETGDVYEHVFPGVHGNLPHGVVPNRVWRDGLQLICGTIPLSGMPLDPYGVEGVVVVEAVVVGTPYMT